MNKSIFSFGQAQIVEFQLNYFVKNDSNQPITKDIPIPPDTAWQKVKLSTIDPKPKNVSTDPDGNWLARYALAPNQELEIQLQGMARLGSNSSYVHNFSPTYLDNLTKSNDLWPRLNSPPSTPKDIYTTVTSTLDYDFTRASSPTEASLENILKNPKNAICTDFTNYFIALARSSGIPSRQIIGYALTNNQSIKPLNQNADILHTWPQYYDSTIKAWKDIDPTWGKTTGGVDYFSSIDLNHLASIIRGISPTQPLPPGSYKSIKNPKSVFVTYSTKPFELDQSPLVKTLVYTGAFSQKLNSFNPNLNYYEGQPPLSNQLSAYPLLTWHNYRLILFFLVIIFGVIILIRKIYEKNS